MKEPGVQRPMTTVTPIAVFTTEGTPDWQVLTDDAVWVTNGPKNTVHRLDIKTNAVMATVEVGKRPCSGLAWGFGSVWVPSCGDNTMSRIDTKTNKVIATLPYGPANSEGGVTASSDSVWMLTDKKGILSRIDPTTNMAVAQIEVPSGSFSCVLGDDGAIWISSTENNLVSRVDPKTNMVTDKINVGAQPRFLTAGGGSIWTLNQGDGTVSRVDVKTKNVTNIQVGIPGTGGEIAYGEGYVWATIPEIPISQIDPATNKVVHQWIGTGGDSIRAGFGSVFLSNLRAGNVWRIHPNQLDAGVAVGMLPKVWQTGGPDCATLAKWQVQEYNPDFYVLRESGCTNYEKPFLYLIFGSERALLEDTGAGKEVETSSAVMDVIAQWAKRNKKDTVPLIVMHSHGHGDHTAGDAQFKDKPNVQFVAAAVPDLQMAFGIEHWPNDIGHVDLGGRVLDVIPIPGHHAASVALYDSRTGLLLTGDSFYPGRLYVADLPAFVASNQRLVDFVRERPVSHILGTHIEQARTPYVDYPRGTTYQPDEHVLELSRGDLLELNDALTKMNGKPDKIVLRDVTVVIRR